MNLAGLKSLDIKPCVPTGWLTGGHRQTLAGHFFPSPKFKVLSERVEIPLEDGDRLVGFHYSGSANTVVSFFHGLGGDTEAPYMQRMAKLCHDMSYPCYLINHRGCGAGDGLAAGPYHSGRGDDISAALAFIRKRHQTHQHIAVGFSLSGNALLLLMSGVKGHVLPDAAIAVNAPIDLASAAELIKAGFNRIYDYNFVKLCRQSIKDRVRAKKIEPIYRIKPWVTLQEFDDLYTAPAGGYKDRHDYYQQCSAVTHLNKISNPTVLVTSKDDPFVDYNNYKNANLSDSVHLHLESHGGHMGYLTNKPTPLGTRRWLDYVVSTYLKALSSSSNSSN